ncbi:MAG: hypothetical protein AAF629_24640 [Chloroflexota bacterium]
MKISLIPWELIWIICLILFSIAAIRSLVKQIKQRQLNLRRNLIVYILLLLVIGIPYTVPLAGYRFMLAENSLEATHLEHDIPDLQSRTYEAYSVDEIYEASLRVIQNLQTYGQQWHIQFAELDAGYSGRIQVQIPVWWGTDQLTIATENQELGQSRRVFLLSATSSRARDFGENARHIKRFYEALDAELAKSP